MEIVNAVPLPDVAVDTDRATVQLHEFLDQSEPDPGAFERAAPLAFDPVEAFEQSRQFGSRNADAGIAHG